MLNYIWAGLVIVSFVFALVNDVADLRNDTFRNGKPLPVIIDRPGGQGSAVTVRIDPTAYQAHFGVAESVDKPLSATLLESDRGREMRFAADASLPSTLGKIRDATAGTGSGGLFKDTKPESLLATVPRYDGTSGAAEILFPPARWLKMQAIGAAAMSFARTSVELALGLIGTLCVFLGIMQVAEKAGIINAVVTITGPILRPLFPGIPKGHPAMGMVTLNLTANMLGLGNAATPFGIKAMEELQKLNKSADTATDSMVMLLAMNTAGVQILPPVFLYAVMGLRASELYIPILIVTGLSLVIAVVSVKLLGTLPGYRLSNPDLLPPKDATTAEVAQ